MGLPSITITFKTAAATANRRSGQGVVAAIIKDSASLDSKYFELTSASEIPAALSTVNKNYLESIFIGNVNRPSKVLVYVLASTATAYTEAFNELARHSFDWIVGDQACSATLASALVTWVKTQREDYGRIYKAVVPATAADYEAVVNFATDDIVVGSDTLETPAYCGRIAGLIAGTPLSQSATYAALSEVTDVERKSITELDTMVDAGKFVLLHDGVKVKTGRAVTSLTTTTNKSEQLKKVKIVEALDLIKNDVRILTEDNYIGKVKNDYDGKCLLLTAIKNYFGELENEGILQSGESTVEIDIDAQRAYLKEQGTNVGSMTDKEIKEASTGSKVFLKASIKILDAIEDLVFTVEF